jgi:hypothetical protein
LLVYDLLDLLLKLLLLALIAVAFGMAVSYKSYGYQVRIGLIGEKTLVVRAGDREKSNSSIFTTPSVGNYGTFVRPLGTRERSLRRPTP